MGRNEIAREICTWWIARNLQVTIVYEGKGTSQY